MPRSIEDLGNISTELSAGFDLDIPIQRLFSTHPLYNAVCWDYFCDGQRTVELGIQSMFGITGTVVDTAARKRLRTPEGAAKLFWELYQRWACPSMQTISHWRVDLATIVLSLHSQFEDNNPVFEIINGKLPGLVEEMKKEFPDMSDAFDRVFQTSFRNTVKLYKQQLEDGRNWQAARVYYIDRRAPNKNKLFFVIEYCVRLLKEVVIQLQEQVGGQDDEKREHVESAFQLGENTQTPQLKPWSFIACDLSPNTRFENLNTLQFWDIPMVQTLVQFPEKTGPAREEIQRMIMYCDVNPSSGIDAAVDDEVQRTQSQDWEEIERIGLFHTAQRPMKEEPWRRTNAPWQNGQISQGNWGMFKELLGQVPRVEEVYHQKGLRHEGEQKYVGAQLKDSGPLDLRPSVEYFEKPDTVPAKKETNYLPFLAIAAVAGYFILS